MINSLGIINCFGVTAAVRLTVNRPNPALRVGAQTIRVQARPGNTGLVYVALAGAAGSPTVDSPQIVAVLAVPAHATQGPFAVYEVSVGNAPAALNCAAFYIIAAAGDEVLTSYTSQ